MLHKLNLLAVVILVSLIIPEQAHAYLDPGTGSMIMQVIVASLVGTGCTIGVYKKKITDFFKHMGHKNGK